MNLVYTEHALARLAKRQLQQDWIEQVVRNPERIEPDQQDPALEHRLGAVPGLAGRVLRVIVSRSEPKRVITAHLDCKLKGRL